MYKYIILVIVLILVVYYGSYLIVRGPVHKKIVVVGHRGGAALAPENTLTAFANAGKIGADGIELDVQMSKDGMLVVMHDETVDRTTNGKGFIKDLTFAQLRALTIRGTGAGKGEVERIPTFAEALAVAKQNGLEMFAEIKSAYEKGKCRYPGIEAKMVQAVKEAGYEKKTKFPSFDAPALEKAAAIAPEIPRIALYGLWQFQLGKTLPGGAKIVASMAEMVILYPWIIKEAHARGEQVYVYPGIIENRWTMSILRSFGVDGMIVNNPLLLRKILNKKV